MDPSSSRPPSSSRLPPSLSDFPMPPTNNARPPRNELTGIRAVFAYIFNSLGLTALAQMLGGRVTRTAQSAQVKKIQDVTTGDGQGASSSGNVRENTPSTFQPPRTMPHFSSVRGGNPVSQLPPEQSDLPASSSEVPSTQARVDPDRQASSDLDTRELPVGPQQSTPRPTLGLDEPTPLGLPPRNPFNLPPPPETMAWSPEDEEYDPPTEELGYSPLPSVTLDEYNAGDVVVAQYGQQPPLPSFESAPTEPRAVASTSRSVPQQPASQATLSARQKQLVEQAKTLAARFSQGSTDISTILQISDPVELRFLLQEIKKEMTFPPVTTSSLTPTIANIYRNAAYIQKLLNDLGKTFSGQLGLDAGTNKKQADLAVQVKWLTENINNQMWRYLATNQKPVNFTIPSPTDFSDQQSFNTWWDQQALKGSNINSRTDVATCIVQTENVLPREEDYGFGGVTSTEHPLATRIAKSVYLKKLQNDMIATNQTENIQVVQNLIRQLEEDLCGGYITMGIPLQVDIASQQSFNPLAPRQAASVKTAWEVLLPQVQGLPSPSLFEKIKELQEKDWGPSLDEIAAKQKVSTSVKEDMMKQAMQSNTPAYYFFLELKEHSATHEDAIKWILETVANPMLQGNPPTINLSSYYIYQHMENKRELYTSDDSVFHDGFFKVFPQGMTGFLREIQDRIKKDYEEYNYLTPLLKALIDQDLSQPLGYEGYYELPLS